MNRLLDTAVEIRQNPEDAERAYMARQLVQCTLPHSDPGDVAVWRRVNGGLTLSVRPYVDSKSKVRYPYGSIPRLLLFWIVTEATQKKTRHIKLGNSLDDFMRAIGLNPRTGGGKRGDAKRLHDQMERLFNAVISFESKMEGHTQYANMVIAEQSDLWWSKSTAGKHQDDIWDSWIELGEKFYDAITAAPVPVDLRALRALKRSPLALDLYAWLTYTAYQTHLSRTSRRVPWEMLHAQMGGEYAEVRFFRVNVIKALRKIRIVYLDLRVETNDKHIVIHPSRTAISVKKKASQTLLLR